MKHVLFDTNIILDIALQRAPFFATACQLFDKIEEGEIKGFVTTSTVTDIYYIARKSLGKRKSIAFIRELVEISVIAKNEAIRNPPPAPSKRVGLPFKMLITRLTGLFAVQDLTRKLCKALKG